MTLFKLKTNDLAVIYEKKKDRGVDALLAWSNLRHHFKIA